MKKYRILLNSKKTNIIVDFDPIDTIRIIQNCILAESNYNYFEGENLITMNKSSILRLIRSARRRLLNNEIKWIFKNRDENISKGRYIKMFKQIVLNESTSNSDNFHISTEKI